MTDDERTLRAAQLALLLCQHTLDICGQITA